MNKPKLKINRAPPILVTCIFEPRGECGLEGYQAGQIYQAQYIAVEPKGPRYWRVWPGDGIVPGVAKELGIDSYYETVGLRSFHRYFATVEEGA